MLVDDWAVCKLMRKPLPQLPSTDMFSDAEKQTQQAEYLVLEQKNIRLNEGDVNNWPSLHGSMANSRSSSRLARFGRLVLCFAIALCVVFSFVQAPAVDIFNRMNLSLRPDAYAAKDTCPQASPITSSVHADLLSDLESKYNTDAFKLKAYESLGGAVRVP